MSLQLASLREQTPINVHKSAIIEGEKRYICDILIYGRISTFSADGGIKITCTWICGKESIQ
jgi:hypothetical protein